jgi:iron complex outermembrane receptor protein
VEGVLYARQSKISQSITTNSATGNSRDVPGYGLLNLYGQYEFDNLGISIRAGVENLLNKFYADPLSGFNRVLDSDVLVGARIPGIGRNFYGKLSYHW